MKHRPDPALRLLDRMLPLMGGFERVAQLLALGLEQEAFDLLRRRHRNSRVLQRDYLRHMDRHERHKKSRML